VNYKEFSNAQLFDTIEKLMVRAGKDEALRSELDAQLADIYNVLSDTSLRDYVGAIDAAIDSHIALTDSIKSRAELLDALMAEYEKRIAIAMAASRTFVGPSYHYGKDGLVH
jgi:hypothetical protein